MLIIVVIVAFTARHSLSTCFKRLDTSSNGDEDADDNFVSRDGHMIYCNNKTYTEAKPTDQVDAACNHRVDNEDGEFVDEYADQNDSCLI